MNKNPESKKPIITVRQFVFQLKASTFIELPEFFGSTLRGSFGNSFKKLACLFGMGNCSNCILKFSCPYSYIFESHFRSSNTLKNFGGSNIPHPYILSIPLNMPRTLKKDDGFHFRFILIGRAQEYLPYFILAVAEMGKRGIGKGRGKFKLMEVNEETPSGSNVIFRNNSLVNYDKHFHLLWKPGVVNYPDIDEIKLQTTTPIKITDHGKLVKDLTFPLILKILFIRINLLSHFHCNNKHPWQYYELLKKAEEITVSDSNLETAGWYRWSQRQKKHILLLGTSGYIIFKGNLKPFLPYLALGQIIHVGKATGFGFGQYKLVPDFTEKYPIFIHRTTHWD